MMDSMRMRLPLSLCFLIIAGFTMTGCPPVETPIFSFAVFSDPHVYGNPDSENAQKLADIVDWVNTYKDDEDKLIELVFVVGDIGGNFSTAKGILDGLTIPYVPVIGDNDVHVSDQAFETAFQAQYDILALNLDNWNKAPTPSWNPEFDINSYFQNFSFDYAGIHFMGMDWCSRASSGMEAEQADLHDFSGGTWPWFTNDITNCDKPFGENIVMLSHHAMHVTPLLPEIEVASFSPAEVDTIEAFTSGYGGNVSADLAGHYHVGWHEYMSTGQYDIYVVEATHIGGKTFKLVRVYSDGAAITYNYQKILVP